MLKLNMINDPKRLQKHVKRVHSSKAKNQVDNFSEKNIFFFQTIIKSQFVIWVKAIVSKDKRAFTNKYYNMKIFCVN